MATGKKSKHTKRGQAPWNREPPVGAKHRALSPKRKASAKASAHRAGRPYPNLVDNMRAASKIKAKGSGKSKTTQAAKKRRKGARHS